MHLECRLALLHWCHCENGCLAAHIPTDSIACVHVTSCKSHETGCCGHCFETSSTTTKCIASSLCTRRTAPINTRDFELRLASPWLVPSNGGHLAFVTPSSHRVRCDPPVRSPRSRERLASRKAERVYDCVIACTQDEINSSSHDESVGACARISSNSESAMKTRLQALAAFGCSSETAEAFAVLCVARTPTAQVWVRMCNTQQQHQTLESVVAIVCILRVT